MKNKTLASHISQYTNTLKNPPNLSQNIYQMSETNKDSVPKIIRIILMDDEEELNAELKKYDYSINTAYCGKSPLYYAIQFNSERCVKILLDREADTTSIVKRFRESPTALGLAVQNGDRKLIRTLLEYPVDVYPPGKPLLFSIFKNDDVKLLRIMAIHDRKLLSHPIRFWSRENDFEYGPDQPIGRAIILKAPKCVEYLIPVVIETETNEEIKRRNILSAIIACIATANHIHLEQLLSMENVDRYIQLPLNNGDSFLHSAVQQRKKNYKTKNQEKIIKLLILSGASVNAKNVNGNTPLHLVKDVRTAKILYGFGASLHLKNSTNQTPAQYFNKNLDDGDEDEDYCILNEWFKLAAEQEKIIEKKIKEATEDTSRPIEVDPDSDINK